MLFFLFDNFISKGRRFVLRQKSRVIRIIQILCAPRHYYTSFYSYSLECPDKIEILSLKQEKMVSAKLDGEKQIFLQYVGQIIVKKTIIQNATCFAYSDVILLDDGRCLYELKELNYLHSMVNYMDEILLIDAKNSCKLKKCHKNKHIEKAIKIGGMFGFNYYHFMFQILPRLFAISDIDNSVPLLFDCSAINIESMRYIVDLCNVKKREIIYMDYDIAYHVKELYTISSPNFCVPNWKKNKVNFDMISSAYSIDNIKKIVDFLLPYATNHPSPENIFICRGTVGKRRKYNEKELLEAAQVYGFEPVYPEQLSYSEQMNIFYNAKVIIAANGAALSNLIYCQSGCSLLMLCNSRLATNLFSSLILIKGGNVVELYDNNQSKGYQGDFYIDPQSLIDNILKLKL